MEFGLGAAREKEREEEWGWEWEIVSGGRHVRRGR